MHLRAGKTLAGAATVAMIATTTALPASANSAVGGQGDTYYLSDNFSTTADTKFEYGPDDAEVYVGDWDGDGQDSLAYRDGAVFHVRQSNSSGSPQHSFAYGRPGDDVLVGDWDGDGRDSLAVRRGAVYHVKNSVRSGSADQVVSYGRAGDEVLVGDFDGSGRDSLAVRRGAEYHVKNSISGGPADRVATYGRSGDDVYVGDWNASGRDTLGVRRDNTYYLANTIRSGSADRVVDYGRPTDTTLVGDWDADGRDTLGVRRGPRTAVAASRSSVRESQASIALDWARTQLGKPYIYGGTGPGGYDCSGLTMRAYEHAGMSLPRTSRAQYGATSRVPVDELQPGDLMFWSSNGRASGIYHVAIYAGNGNRVQAPYGGRTVEEVPVYSVNLLPYGGRVS